MATTSGHWLLAASGQHCLPLATAGVRSLPTQNSPVSELSESQSHSCFTTGCLPPFCLGSKPLEDRDQVLFFFFATEPFALYCLCNTLSDERMGLSLKNMLGLSSSVRIAHVACYWKINLCALCRSPLSPGFAKHIMSGLFILCYNGSLVTLTVVSLTAAKFNPLIFLMYSFAFSYAANMSILMILYDFCLLPALHNFVIWSYTYGRPKAECKSPTGVHLGKFPMMQRTSFFTRCSFKRYLYAANSQEGQVEVISHLITALWKVGFMLALKRSLLNKEISNKCSEGLGFVISNMYPECSNIAYPARCCTASRREENKLCSF
jgi:hypothetical protein